MSSAPSFEVFLNAARQPNYAALKDLLDNDALRRSSATWTDEQRIEFLTRSKHVGLYVVITTGTSIRVLRTALAADANWKFLTDEECTDSAHRTAANFLTMIVVVSINRSGMTREKEAEYDAFLLAKIPYGKPWSVHMRWYSL